MKPATLSQNSARFNSPTDNQETRYVYGGLGIDSDISRPDLLRAVIYPDSNDNGGGTGSNYDRVEFAWNRLGELKIRSDQLGTLREYTYDKFGRWIAATNQRAAVKRCSA